jgi:hypothetical protein
MPVPGTKFLAKNDSNQKGTGIDKLVELYCDVDDFYKVFIPQLQKQLLEDGTQKRQCECRMSTSEIMETVVSFHMSH